MALSANSLRDAIEEAFCDAMALYGMRVSEYNQRHVILSNEFVDLIFELPHRDYGIILSIYDKKTNRTYTLYGLMYILGREYQYPSENEYPKNVPDSIRFHANIEADIVSRYLTPLLEGKSPTTNEKFDYERFMEDLAKKKNAVTSMPHDHPIFLKYINNDLSWYDDIKHIS